MNCTRRRRTTAVWTNTRSVRDRCTAPFLSLSLISCRLNTKSFSSRCAATTTAAAVRAHSSQQSTKKEEENGENSHHHRHDALFCRSSLRRTSSSMTLTEQASRGMVVFQNVVFKHDTAAEHDQSMDSPMKLQQAKRLDRSSVFARLSKRFSNKSRSTAPIESFPPASSSSESSPPPPPIVSLERQNSFESDLSLSKLDLTDDYSGGIDRSHSLNTSRQTMELDLNNAHASSLSTPQRFLRTVHDFYSRLAQKRRSAAATSQNSSATLDSNARLTGHTLASNRRSLFDHQAFVCCSWCFATHRCRRQSAPNPHSVLF